MEKIKVYRKCGIRWDYKYKIKCNGCQKERLTFNKDSLKLCKSCSSKISHLVISQKTRNKMSNAKKGRTPWNKGKVNIYTDEARYKMGAKRRNKEPHNIGKVMPEEQKIKLSCINRNIDIKDFDEFSTPANRRDRGKFDHAYVRQKCYSDAEYTCDIYGTKDAAFNAHHIESWHSNEDKRFSLDNLACLSLEAHKTFHYIYGNKNNTRAQYDQFKSEIFKYRQVKQVLFLIAGCPASGKSWVCNKLADKFNYISYDGVNKKYHIYQLLKNNSKPLLYDPTINVSTFIKRYSHLFDIKLIVIKEDEHTITNRILGRGGSVTKTIKKRIKRMIDISKNCEFSGTSDQVLEYLMSK